MKGQNPLESICVSVEDDTATIYWANNKRTLAQLPASILNRSCLLSQAISDDVNYAEVSLSLPVGVMEAWLEGLGLLEVDLRPPGGKSSSLRLKRPRIRHGLSICLQAADFLDDQEALKGLCTHTCHQLFAPFLDDRLEALDEGIARELCELPSNLQQLLIDTMSDIPLLVKLRLLPQPFQEIALHAAFPTIATTSSLTVPTFHQQNEYVTGFWDVVGRMTSLQHLDCTWNQSRVPQMQEELFCKITILTCLKSLKFSGFGTRGGVSDYQASRLASCLACLSSLQSLDLSDNGISSQCVMALASTFANLQCLRCLDLSGNDVQGDCIRAIATAIAKLPELQTLNIRSCGYSTDAQNVLGTQFMSTALSTGEIDLTHISESTSAESHGLAEPLSKLTSLKVLKIQRLWQPHVSYTDACSQMHSELLCLYKLTRLEELHIQHFLCTACESSMCRTHMHMQQLLEQITTLTALRTLNLHRCSMNSEAVVALGDLMRHLPHLQNLDCGDLSWVQEDFAALLASFSYVTVLKSLKLNHSRQPAPAALASFLQFASNLTALNLLGCKFLLIDDGPDLDLDVTASSKMDVTALASSLRNLSCLQHLSLELDFFESPYFAESIGGMISLQSLVLLNSVFTEISMAAFAPQLPKMQNLQVLDLRGLHLDGNCIEILVEHLGSVTSLHTLALDRSHFGRTGAAALAPAIGKLTSLTYLSLEGNNLEFADCLFLQFSSLVCLSCLNVSGTVYISIGATEALVRSLSKITALQRLGICRRVAIKEELRKYPHQHCPYQMLHIESFDTSEDLSDISEDL